MKLCWVTKDTFFLIRCIKGYFFSEEKKNGIVINTLFYFDLSSFLTLDYQIELNLLLK